MPPAGFMKAFSYYLPDLGETAVDAVLLGKAYGIPRSACIPAARHAYRRGITDERFPLRVAIIADGVEAGTWEVEILPEPTF